MNKKIINIAFMVAAIILGVISYIVLPDMVVIQMNMKGEASNVVPKIVAVVLPIVLTFAGSVMGLKDDGESSKKAMLISIVGIGVAVITLIFNR